MLPLQAITPEMWLIGVLITVLLAVFSVLGALLKVTYDAAKKLGLTIYGDPDAERDQGFIDEAMERHDRLQEQHEEVYEQLLIQGRLLSELAYAFGDIAEEMEDHDDMDVESVDLDRIQRLRREKENDAQDLD